MLLFYLFITLATFQLGQGEDELLYYEDFLTCEFLIGYKAMCESNVSFWHDDTMYYKNLTERFVTNTTEGLNSGFQFIQSAYEFYKKCYSSRSGLDPVCDCFVSNMPYIYKPYFIGPWAFMFETKERVNLVKKLVTDMNNKFSNDYMPLNETMHFFHHDDYLHKFCYAFSWSQDKINSFRPSLNCMNVFYWDKIQFCASDFIDDFTLQNLLDNITLLDRPRAELFLGCLYRSLVTVDDLCPFDFKFYIILHNIMLKPELFNSNEANLVTYVNTVIQNATKNYERASSNKLTTWIGSTGQVFSYKKKRIDSISCNYNGETRTYCYKSDVISIECGISSARYFEWARFEFRLSGSQVVSYYANQTYFPSVFDSNTTKIVDPVTNQTILEIRDFHSTLMKLIVNYKLGVSIILSKTRPTWVNSFYMVFRAHTSFYDRYRSTGLLVDGCLNNAIKETKDILDDCHKACQSQAQQLNDLTSMDSNSMTTINLNNICYFDCSTTKQMYSIEHTEALVRGTSYLILNDLSMPEPTHNQANTQQSTRFISTTCLVLIIFIIQ